MPRSLLRRAKLFVLPFLALAFGYSAASAQTIVNSDGPSKVAITVYRDANRGDQPIRPNWPGGYALITETRTLSIPAGESVIRFEGVSEGMYPESAIVTGLPRGVKEKNRDARLLSPAGLVDAYLKREVTLMRTDRATGKVREQTAMITAGPTGGVILETGEGYEALRCTGLPERLKFARVPADLAAKPTLSVITQSDRAVTATVTLTYMAAGFDWQANYVIHAGKFRPANEVDLDVFAWLTVANGGNQSFNDAELQVVAGRLNKRANAYLPAGPSPQLRLSCWPMQRTDQVPLRVPYTVDNYGSMPDADESMVVTAMRRKNYEGVMAASLSPAAPAPAVVAQQEELGDLKLYRVPERMSVNAKGQKQVAMIVQPDAKFRQVYRTDLGRNLNYTSAFLLEPNLVSMNEEVKGLGVPLPSGQAMIFENGKFGDQLVAQLKVSDLAVGQKVELPLAASAQVRGSITILTRSKEKNMASINLTNAKPYPVSAEIKLPVMVTNKSENVLKVDGRSVWFVTIPANGSAELAIEGKQP
jgi:hypothetical protein